MFSTEIAAMCCLVATAVGYFRCERFRFYINLALFPSWLLLCSAVMIPIAYFDPGPQNFSRISRLIRLARPVLGVTYKLRGAENIPKGAAVVVCNHQSHLDVAGILSVWDAFSPMAPISKKELKTQSLSFGPFLALAGACFINRSSFAEKSKKDLDDWLKQARISKTSVLIFPEGTRNKTGLPLLPFKKGAFHIAVQSQMPILPVIFSDFSSFYSLPEKRFTRGEATVTVLPPISTVGMGLDEVAGLCAKTQNLMQDFIQQQRDAVAKNANQPADGHE